MNRKEYRSENITVSFDRELCIHFAECVRSLPEVFDVEKRPWIQPDRSEPDTVAGVVARCPTGALQLSRKDGGPGEPVPQENTVTIAKDGPLYVRGDVVMKEYDGSTLLENTRLALCRCGESQNKPFCDNSHRSSGFRDEGSVGANLYEASPGTGGRLEIRLAPNGPLFLKGEFELWDAAGRAAYRESRAALCRCGRSGGKPFCDGSHSGARWRDD